MPAPVSLTDDLDLRSPARDSRSRRVPPSGVNLIAFDSRFQTICCSRSGSARIGRRRRIEVASRTLMRLAAIAGPTRFDRAAQDVGDVDRPRVEPQLAADRARDVEQVVDQPRLRLGVALDGGDRARLLLAASSSFVPSMRAQP